MDKAARKKRVDDAIGALLVQYDFFGYVLLSVKLVEDADMPVPTMATDGRRLFYHPDYVDKCTEGELFWTLAHEALHIALLHPLRKTYRQHLPWTYVCDIEVNQLLKEEESKHSFLQRPKDVVPGRQGIAEDFYEEIPVQKLCCSGGGGNGQCGGVQSPELAPGESEEQLRTDMEGMVRVAATRAQLAGKLPAGMQRLLDDLLAPKIPWREVLRKFVETQNEREQTWNALERRFLHQNVVLPGIHHTPRVSRIAWGIDTSGSVGEIELNVAASEVRGCFEECYDDEVVLPIIWFDSEAYLDFVAKGDALEPKGGGGTRFAAVMECVAQNELDVGGLVILTDGYCSDFGEEPKVPVLWVVYGELSKEGAFTPPFGEVLPLELD